MRIAVISFVCLLGFASTSRSVSGPIDLSSQPEDVYHRYVGHVIMVTGRISLHGKFGALIDTGKAQIFLMAAGSCDPALDGHRLVVVGTLRFQGGPHFLDPARKAPPTFFYCGWDGTLHYSPPVFSSSVPRNI